MTDPCDEALQKSYPIADRIVDAIGYEETKPAMLALMNVLVSSAIKLNLTRDFLESGLKEFYKWGEAQNEK